ncbi:hypothetical protein D3C80_1258650 [compost metagenome]
MIKDLRLSVFGFVGVALLFWVFSQIVLSNLYFSQLYKVGGKFSHALIFYFPLSHLSSFFVGIATAYALITYKSRLGGKRAIVFNFVVGVLSAGLIYWVLNARVSSVLGFNILNAAGGLAPLYALFVFSIVVSSRAFCWFLANKFSILLGEASYALYILQLPVFLAFNELFVNRYLLSADVAFYLYFLLLVLISIFVFIFMERPIRDLLNSVYRRHALRRAQPCVA